MNYKLLLPAFFGIFISCKKQNGSQEALPTLFQPPVTVKLDTLEGYTINPFTGDSIPVLNYFTGELIPSGVPVEIQGRPVDLDTMSPPIKVVADVVTDIPLPSNTNIISPTRATFSFVNNTFSRYVPSHDSTDIILLNSYGDTIPLEEPVRITETTQSLINPPGIPAKEPRSRDNSIFDIQYLNLDNGLNDEDIHSIMQDENHIVWLGTKRTLSRYDGSTIRNYTGDNGTAIPRTAAMIMDSKGNHWLGTDLGIYCISDSTFTSIREQEKLLYINGVNSIIEDSEENLWFGLWNGVVVRYKRDNATSSGTLTHFILNAHPSPGMVTSIVEDNHKNLWFGTTRDGLFRYDRKEFVQITESDGLPSNSIMSLCKNQNGEILIGTTKGFCILNHSLNNQPGTMTILSQKDGLVHDVIRCLIQDKSGNIWLGTWGGGINKLSFIDGKIKVQRFTESEGLSNNMVNELYEDADENIWAGTIGGGINIIRLGSFEHFTEVNFPTKLIRNIYEDNNKNLWIGTEGIGIFLIPFEANDVPKTIKQITTGEGYTIRWTSVVFEDSKGNIWFGSTEGVLKAKSPINGKLEFDYYASNEGFTNAWPTCIMEDSKGNIWLGTFGGGLIQWITTGSPDKYKLIHYTEGMGFSCDYITGLAEGKDGSIWVSTDLNGLANIKLSEDEMDGKMIVYSQKEGLPGNNLYGLSKDENNNLWIGTEGAGIFTFKIPEGDQDGFVTSYSVNQGLSDGFVRGIHIADEKDRIWVTTNNGLNLFQLQDTGNVQIQSIGKYEGLKRTDFNNCNILIDHTNNLWLGTRRGLEKLPLNNFKVSNNIPKPFLRQIDINEKAIIDLQPKDQSKQGIWFEEYSSQELYPVNPELSFKNNHLTFHYSAVDWQAPQKIKYSYFMEGTDDHWSIPSHETKAEYRNLPSGTHTFQVRAIGQSQKWSEPSLYTFTIRPPWWSSWFAFAMYGLFGGLILYRSHRFQVNRKLEIAERQRLVELDRIKNRLYTNITHEFRTPLTLIHGPVLQAISKNSSLDQKEIQSIYRQSERLQQLINQMLELQKLESGMLKPHFTYGEIIQTTRYLFASFEAWAEEKKISLLFSSSLQEVYMDFDKEKLTQIITNLVSNAIKHTPRNGKIGMVIDVTRGGEYLSINVTDTGSGISVEDLPYIFDRFYQSKKAASGGTGIGLALVKNLTELLGGKITVDSKVDQGSTFSLMLPITRQAPIVIQPSADLPINFNQLADDETQPQKTGKPLVLVVEDHPEVLKYIVSCLSQDYDTITAANGNEGLRMAEEQIPDLIISDVMMPGKDGFELCTIIKKDIKTSHIPVILLTGKGDHEAMLSGIEQGADAYVLKPFDPVELNLRVRKLLELRNTLSRHYLQHAVTGKVESLPSSSLKESQFLKQLKGFVQEHMNDSQFNMNMLCQHMAMSHPQLHRKVTALTGESTGKFVRSIRLTKAIELLIHSDMTISEIAYETGFTDPGYFTKVFTKEHNISPSEYRAKST